MVKMKTKAQEEMIGFALIVIIIAVIILIFISFSFRSQNEEPVESYEAQSFAQIMLEYTSDCRDNYEYLSVQDLIIDCEEGRKCLDERETCEVLEGTLEDILDKSWRIGEGSLAKGYALNISSESEEVLFIQNGNLTNNYEGAVQPLGKHETVINFKLYY